MVANEEFATRSRMVANDEFATSSKMVANEEVRNKFQDGGE